MERSVYACKAMLLLRLNYFELKVLRVHCTGGSFCPEDFERCQRRASQDLYRKLMLPVETEPNSHRSERGECGRKQSLFSKISHSTCSSCILMLLLWHIWASCSYNLTIRPDFRHFWGASHKALKMYFLSFLMLFHRVSLTAIYCIWKMFVHCQNWLSVNKSAAESERCSKLCHFGVLVQLMSLWDSRWKDCYDDHSLYSVLSSVFPSFANDVIACCGILPESLALAPPLLPFTHVTWARGPSWIFSSIWGCGNTIIQKKSFTISAFKLERSSILKGQGRLTAIRPKEKCNVSVKWVSS